MVLALHPMLLAIHVRSNEIPLQYFYVILRLRNNFYSHSPTRRRR
jgi:hypothetical protein